MWKPHWYLENIFLKYVAIWRYKHLSHVRNVRDYADRSIMTGKIALFMCWYMCLFQFVRKFGKLIEWLILSHAYFAKSSAFFLKTLVLISTFCEAFFRSRFWYNFLTSSILIWLNLTIWELFLFLINPLQPGVAFLYHLKTSEKLKRFSDVFRGYRIAPLGCNGLIKIS